MTTVLMMEDEYFDALADGEPKARKKCMLLYEANVKAYALLATMTTKTAFQYIVQHPANASGAWAAICSRYEPGASEEDFSLAVKVMQPSSSKQRRIQK
jgi:hypothetical protein